MKVALVHDWLTGMRGGEKVLEFFCDFFPQAELFTLLHIPGTVSKTIEDHKIKTSYLQKIPWMSTKYRYALPLMPHAVQTFDLSGFDLVISTSHCVAKGCLPQKDATHICYCFTPMRYIWDQFDHYFGENVSGFAARSVMKGVRPYLQKWDTKSSERVSHFIADSIHVKKRINKYYQRNSAVIYPPVDTDYYSPDHKESRSDFYLIVSALAPYKRLDIAVDSFNMNGKKLKIIGSGQLESKLKARAKSNIEFLGWLSDEKLRTYYRTCKGLLFPGIEDFGIVPVEAQACGTPLIAYGEGGALETVEENKTGIFFKQPTKDSLLESIEIFESKRWDSSGIRLHAEKFSKEEFKKQIKRFLDPLI